MENVENVAGEKLISVSSAILMILGVCEIISSSLILDSSSGNYPGGLYVGIVCFLTGLRGVNPIDKRKGIQMFLFFCIISLISSIVGVILQTENSKLMNSLVACVSKNNAIYYGNSGYYDNLNTCGGIQSTPCTCISDTNECHSFNDFPSSKCFNILNSLPGETSTGASLSIVCLVFSAYLIALSIISWKAPYYLEYFDSTPELDDTNINMVAKHEPKYQWWVKYMHFCSETDDGVPFFCRHRFCPLDHRNRLTNDNKYIRLIGPFGYEYFDMHRRFYLGLASIFTIIAMVLTIWGCFALSTNRFIVQRTYWAAGTGTNTTSGNNFSMYVGLRSLEYVECVFEPGYNKYPSNCPRQSVHYDSEECKSGPVSTACSVCSNAASAMWATAFMSCASMILALAGAQTRMRTIADVPVQKLMGMYSDLWGALSLAVALFTFENTCFHNLHTAFNGADLSTAFWVGPGLYCYAVCCISGLVRALAHWLTPLPGQGATTVCFLCYSPTTYASRVIVPPIYGAAETVEPLGIVVPRNMVIPLEA